ncbi:HemK family methyltransferase [Apiospora phragmitis]|uniref:HemK family methyltransferase n=1 Tax=Apiospora phragmitis TaxID=2905665 RepID=A0ABR1SXD8_9PEZI
MPRLPPSLLQRARSISPDLATLLPACRDLESARNELRWIREHVFASSGQSQVVSSHGSSKIQVAAAAAAAVVERERSNHAREVIASLCRRRARGEPLQYLLGSQPFGPLEIQCRRGVLIPRPETETWAYALASEVAARLKASSSASAAAGHHGQRVGKSRRLRIVDFCTGTGCIPLLLYALLHKRFQLQVWGFDVEERAVRLARENLRYNVARGLMPPPSSSSPNEHDSTPENGGDVIRFEKADIFADDWLRSLLQQGGGESSSAVDVLVSNPPYISAKSFNRDTGRSVRNFEPRLALVPHLRNAQAACAPEDVFYKRLCEVAEVLQPMIMLFEVGDLEQATRVAQMAVVATGERLKDLEIWRDCPDVVEEEHMGDSSSAITETYVEGRKVSIRGSGHGRSVFVHLR